jgi:hypothetical protein
MSKRISRNIKDHLRSKFPWWDDLSVAFCSIPDQHEPHIFRACHSDIKQLFSNNGIRYDINKKAITGVMIMEYIRRRDPNFPRHYDVDSMIDFITSPKILHDNAILSKVLIAMGLNSSVAPEVASYIFDNRGDLLIAGSNGGYSWGDALFSNLPSVYEVFGYAHTDVDAYIPSSYAHIDDAHMIFGSLHVGDLDINEFKSQFSSISSLTANKGVDDVLNSSIYQIMIHEMHRTGLNIRALVKFHDIDNIKNTLKFFVNYDTYVSFRDKYHAEDL